MILKWAVLIIAHMKPGYNGVMRFMEKYLDEGTRTLAVILIMNTWLRLISTNSTICRMRQCRNKQVSFVIFRSLLGIMQRCSASLMKCLTGNSLSSIVLKKTACFRPTTLLAVRKAAWISSCLVCLRCVRAETCYCLTFCENVSKSRINSCW